MQLQQIRCLTEGVSKMFTSSSSKPSSRLSFIPDIMAVRVYSRFEKKRHFFLWSQPK